MEINKISNQTFNGLIRTICKDTISVQNGLIHYKEMNYYPFKDETASAIESFKKENEKLVTCNKYPQFVISTIINIKNALPFTKGEFAEYKQGSVPADLKELIEKSLNENDLFRYLNNFSRKTGIKKILGFFI